MRRLLCVFALAGASYAVDLEQALSAYRANPADWKLAHQAALAFTERSQFSEAAEFYRKALAGNPAFVPARKNLAVVLWFAGRHAEAERLFRRLAREFPKDPVPQLYLGLAAHENKQFTEARRRFVNAGDLAFANPDVVPEVVESFLAGQDKSILPRAMEQLGASRNVELSMRVAAVLDRYGEPERAYEVFRSALAFAPNHEPLLVAFASFASSHQNPAYGLEILDRGLAAKPTSSVLLFHRGILSALAEKPDQAKADLEKASAANPSWSMPKTAQGLLLLEAGQLQDAVAKFREVLAAHPGDGQAAYLCAVALSRAGDPTTRGEQIALLEAALKANSKDARILALLGQNYSAEGQGAKGLAFLTKAVAADDQNATAHYQLSLALRRVGRAAEAEKHMTRFRELQTKKHDSELVQLLRVVR